MYGQDENNISFTQGGMSECVLFYVKSSNTNVFIYMHMMANKDTFHEMINDIRFILGKHA